MHFYKKAHAWIKESLYIFHRVVAITIHRDPPKHYLGYTVAGKVPVILIPGILGKWMLMKHLGDKISLRGHPVYIVPQLGYNIYSIPLSAKMLRTLIVHIIPKFGHIPPKVSRGAQAIRNLIEKENLKGVILIAHSKGGLIGKYLLAHHNSDHRVLGMIAVATPFSGSAMAKLIPHDSFKELKADSEIIHDLETHKKVNGQIISIFPAYDTHIWAEKGSFLDGAQNIEVPVGGHDTLLNNKKIQKAVIASVDKMTKRV